MRLLWKLLKNFDEKMKILTLVCYGFGLERPAREKSIGLFGLIVRDEQVFITLPPWPNVTKLLTSVIYGCS